MSIFSKERIEQFIAHPLDFGLTRGEQMEMAKELLELRSLYASATECYLEQAQKVDDYESAKPVSREDAVARFREYNIGFPVERFKADYVIAWMLANYPPQPAPVVPDKNGLLPCPFCGGEPEEDAGGCSEFHGHEHQDYSITCKQCGAEVYCSVGTFEKADVPCSCHHDTRKVCVDKWNKRAAVLNQAPVKQPSRKPKSELLQRAEKLAEDTAALAQRVQCEDLRAKVRAEHAEWATATFGNTGPVGPLKHLSAEALEAAAAPDDLSEWADMQFLFWDAQRKAGISDEQITQAMVAKLQVNKARQWPEPKEGEPRFHIKDGE